MAKLFSNGKKIGSSTLKREQKSAVGKYNKGIKTLSNNKSVTQSNGTREKVLSHR